ncbi:MAG: tripartite tricarboxylate transporter TctB family protein [Deltaproteobacteria bacterium]|nr:tripartite tricarboxylate transporter TctB family protein [Deltaproteobacteria bacterium]
MKGPSFFGYRIPIKQLVGGLFLWSMVAIVFWSTRKMTFYAEGAPGPRFMPVVLSVCLGILNLLYWVESATKESVAKPQFAERNLVRPAGFLAIIILLVLCWEPLGAMSAVSLCAILELRFLERYSWSRSILASFVISGATLVLFQFVLGVPLPGGLFEMLSYVRL